MLTALIIAAFLLAASTVRSWWYRKLWRASVKLNTELLEQNSDLRKTAEGARTIAKIAARGMREKEEEFWPEILL